MTRYHHDSWVLATAATSNPVTLAAAKAHCRIDTGADDDYVTALISAATDYAQGVQNRQYINATYTLNLNGLPPEIYVPVAPLSSVTTFAYNDSNGAAQTLTENSDFVVDKKSEPGRIKPHPDSTGWPDTYAGSYNAVTITLVVGYGASAANIPSPMKERIQQAILIMVSHLYEMREPILTGTIITQVPWSAMALLQMNRMWRF